MNKIVQDNLSAMSRLLSEKGLDSNWDIWQERIEHVTSSDVEKALFSSGTYSLEKILSLVSPAAEKYLEQMAQAARQLTIQRFGRTVRLYAPLYLSNLCVNSCLYCGFSALNSLPRTRLTIEQALSEAEIIAAEGFRDILLVSSEDRKFIDIQYLSKLAAALRQTFSSISVEIYPMETEEYRQLFEAGIDGVTLYQETYNRQRYGYYHPKGPKSDYDYRLQTPQRAAAAGMRQVGIGALLGLEDWRIETLAMAEHAHYLSKHFWQSQISFSFPRMRPASCVDKSNYNDKVSDSNLVQMMTALRLCFPDAGLILSTRERQQLRDNLAGLCITKMSAGSKTSPGGYSCKKDAVEQFTVNDTRTPAQVAKMLKTKGLDSVWKDWDSGFQTGKS